MKYLLADASPCPRRHRGDVAEMLREQLVHVPAIRVRARLIRDAEQRVPKFLAGVGYVREVKLGKRHLPPSARPWSRFPGLPRPHYLRLQKKRGVARRASRRGLSLTAWGLGRKRVRHFGAPDIVARLAAARAPRV